MIAVVLGSDSPIGLTLIRELGAHGVAVHAVGRDRRSIGGASRFAAGNHARPEGPVADWLPGLIARIGATGLLAVSEPDLVALAALPEVIGGCRIVTPRAPQLAAVLDKTATFARAAELGFDIPETWHPECGEDFAARAATLDYPVVLKWSDPTAIQPLLEQKGVAFRKSEFALDAGQLIAALGRYDVIGRWPLVQCYCAGAGVGQMLHMQGGRATLRFQHARLHEWPPEGGVSTLCRSIPPEVHAAQMARSEALLAALGWEGPAMVEYRHDARDGRFWLMEVNGRFWGSLPLASACGAEFGWETYRHAVLGQTDEAPPATRKRTARYLIPEMRRLARVAFAPGRIDDPLFRRRLLADIVDFALRSFDPNTRPYVWRWRDPLPSLRDVANMAAKLTARRSDASAP